MVYWLVRRRDTPCLLGKKPHDGGQLTPYVQEAVKQLPCLAASHYYTKHYVASLLPFRGGAVGSPFS